MNGNEDGREWVVEEEEEDIVQRVTRLYLFASVNDDDDDDSDLKRECRRNALAMITNLSNENGKQTLYICMIENNNWKFKPFRRRCQKAVCETWNNGTYCRHYSWGCIRCTGRR